MDKPCLSHPKVCFIVKVCLHWVCTVPICLELFKPVDSRRRLRALPLGQSGGVSLLSHCNEHHHQRGETTKCVHQFPGCLFVSVVDAIHTLLLWGYTRSHHVIYHVIPASSWWEYWDWKWSLAESPVRRSHMRTRGLPLLPRWEMWWMASHGLPGDPHVVLQCLKGIIYLRGWTMLSMLSHGPKMLRCWMLLGCFVALHKMTFGQFWALGFVWPWSLNTEHPWKVTVSQLVNSAHSP